MSHCVITVDNHTVLNHKRSLTMGTNNIYVMRTANKRSVEGTTQAHSKLLWYKCRFSPLATLSYLVMQRKGKTQNKECYNGIQLVRSNHKALLTVTDLFKPRERVRTDISDFKQAYYCQAEQQRQQFPCSWTFAWTEQRNMTRGNATEYILS